MSISSRNESIISRLDVYCKSNWYDEMGEYSNNRNKGNIHGNMTADAVAVNQSCI